MLERHAGEVKTEGNRLFWNPETQRFNACVDADGKTHDYGFTFLNLRSDLVRLRHARARAGHHELAQRRPRRGRRHSPRQGHLPLALRPARHHEAQPGLVFLGLEQSGEHSLGRPGAGRRRGARLLLPRSDGAPEGRSARTTPGSACGRFSAGSTRCRPPAATASITTARAKARCKAAARRAGWAWTWSSSRARWCRKSCSTAFSASRPAPTASSSIRACRRTGRS